MKGINPYWYPNAAYSMGPYFICLHFPNLFMICLRPSEVTCPEPTPPLYSRMEMKTPATYNTTLTVNCLTGYWFQRGLAALTLVCGKDGNWSHTPPPCRCEQVEIIYFFCHGSLQLTGFLFELGKTSKFPHTNHIQTTKAPL